MPLINYEINLILTWSENCVISSATGATKFAMADKKRYAPVVTLSTEDNINVVTLSTQLLKQLESGLKE